MPIILPPAAFEVPAIIQIAAHVPAVPATAPKPAPHRTTIPPAPGPQPLDTGQNPDIVGSPAAQVPVPPPPPPPPSSATSSDWKR
jgi:hypothetical protein